MTNNEIAKLALECLKTRLETTRVAAETDRANAQALLKLAEELPTILGTLYGWLEKLAKGGVPPPRGVREPSFTLSRDDLMFFAKKARLSDLERLIADLTEVLEARKREGAERE